MSLVLAGNEATIILFFLIAVNGFLCYKRIPVLGVPLGIISFVLLIGINIQYTSFNIMLSLILLVFAVANLYLNIQNFRK